MDAEVFVIMVFPLVGLGYLVSNGMYTSFFLINLSTTRRLSGPELSSEVGALRMCSGACMLLTDTMVTVDTCLSENTRMVGFNDAPAF